MYFQRGEWRASLARDRLYSAEQYFRTDHLQADLRRRALRGGTAALASQGCKFFLQLVSTAVLARLLTPGDYGSFAIVFAVVTFFSIFKDLGLHLATVQRAEITHEQISALFWINFGMSCALALLTALSAPAVGLLYGEPRLVWMTVALGAGFLFAGLGSQHRALLRRQLSMTLLSAVDLASFFLGVVVAICSALLGARYWSLVLMQLAAEAGGAAGLWAVCRWRPGRPSRRAGVRPMLVFGGHLTGFEVISYLTRKCDDLIVGWYCGVEQLGFYDKAYQLLLLPARQFAYPLSGVTIPVLSRLQNDPRRYREYFEKCILFVVAPGMPLVAFLFVVAGKAIPFILGDQWAGSVALFRALAPAAFLGTLNSGVGWIFVSLGRTRRQFKWSLAVSVLTLVSFFVGVRWGAVGVAVAYTAGRVLVQLPTLIYSCHGTPLSWVSVVKTVSRPALASVAAAAVLALVDARLSSATNRALTLTAEAALYLLLYVAAWAALPDGRRTMRETLALAKSFWRKGEEADQV
ncbi:MAG TPA: lipopolysaccharide biosynthesis protein [Pyrinomonadaceae bacterium]|jgi:PST family polysaccharide transporter|nr:lipopolysaccharide biosynthesis protein [Pyrinomonadaceae bacterium]